MKQKRTKNKTKQSKTKKTNKDRKGQGVTETIMKG